MAELTFFCPHIQQILDGISFNSIAPAVATPAILSCGEPSKISPVQGIRSLTASNKLCNIDLKYLLAGLIHEVPSPLSIVLCSNIPWCSVSEPNTEQPLLVGWDTRGDC